MKKIFILLALLCTTLTLSAGPIGEARARQIAEEFFAEHATTRSSEPLQLEWAGNAINEPINIGDKLNTSLMYIYNRGENSGFVVVAGDDNIHPIIAYSFDTTFNSNDMADATKAILDAWCKQINQARKSPAPVSNTTRATTRYSSELLYDTALWNQGEPYNREAPVYDGYRSVTGCVATAMAIICYYNRWPEYGVGTTPEYSYYDAYDQLQTVPANTLGRAYDYDNMLLDYNNGYTETQANAVAALMKDIGTAVKMMYHYTESGAYDVNVSYAFPNYLQYSKSSQLLSRDNYGVEEWHDMMRDNLNRYGPTYYSGSSNAGGHAFVLDGYSTDNYFHFNFGWGGYSNGYYLIPHIEYYKSQMAMLYLEPDRDGTTKYRDNIELISLYSNGEIVFRGISSDAKEYVQGGTYNFRLGGFYNIGARAYNGTISLVHCSKDGQWKEQIFNTTISDLFPDDFTYIDYDVPITINSHIEEGDILRLYSKSFDSEEWQMLKRYGDNTSVVYEILLCATPEEVAETLIFHFDKEQNVIFIESPHAIQAELYRPSGEVTEVQEKAHGYIWYRILEGGEHILKVHSGGEPYIMKLKL